MARSAEIKAAEHNECGVVFGPGSPLSTGMTGLGTLDAIKLGTAMVVE
jgi:hypothetical protein